MCRGQPDVTWTDIIEAARTGPLCASDTISARQLVNVLHMRVRPTVLGAGGMTCRAHCFPLFV